MSTERTRSEVFVGLFLVLGFGAIACMVIIFGKSGEGSKSSYQLTVEFPNASGLVKGANVLVAGANVGRVVAGPNLAPGTYKITAVIAVRDDVKLPRTSKFLIGSSGLLGDRFVDIQMPEGYNLDDPLKPGEYIEPSKSGGGGGLSELTDKGSVVMDKLVTELEHVQALTLKLEEGLLHEKNLKNLEETFDNLKATTEHFRDASKDLDAVVSKAGSLLETAESTVKTYNATGSDVQEAVADLRKTLASTTKTVDGVAALVKKASEGEGPLGTLIGDKKMAEDLRSLASNLRRTGVLFYKDRPAGATPAPTATPKPRR